MIILLLAAPISRASPISSAAESDDTAITSRAHRRVSEGDRLHLASPCHCDAVLCCASAFLAAAAAAAAAAVAVCGLTIADLCFWLLCAQHPLASSIVSLGIQAARSTPIARHPIATHDCNLSRLPTSRRSTLLQLSHCSHATLHIHYQPLHPDLCDHAHHASLSETAALCAPTGSEAPSRASCSQSGDRSCSNNRPAGLCCRPCSCDSDPRSGLAFRSKLRTGR